jgi:hypothetical protein
MADLTTNGLAMARILHITDLHLSDGSSAKSVDDVKDSELVPGSERRSQLDAVYQTFREYAASRADVHELSAIVLSGDLALMADESASGYVEKILEILEPIAKKGCPVVVVPGNHDVIRGHRGAPDYYLPPPKTGLRTVRPYLGAESKLIDAYHLDADSGILFLAINSAEYSGATRDLAIVSAALERIRRSYSSGRVPEDIGIVGSYLDKATHADGLLISPAQFQFLANAERQAEMEWTRSGDNRPLFKVAVVHHHLLPVSPVEEIKPYESLVNLSQLRHFLMANRFHMVLHGHKHQFLAYYDSIPDLMQPQAPYHRVFIVSGPQLLNSSGGSPAFLEIELTTSRAPKVVITPFAIAHGAFPLQELATTTRRLYDLSDCAGYPEGAPLVVFGNDVAETHARVLDRLAGTGGEATNLVCHVEHIEESFDETITATLFAEQEVILSGGKPHRPLPSRYPPNAAERFREIVNWWQMNNSGPSVGFRFTHGSRVRDYGPAIDQLDKAKLRLKGGSLTTKAVVTLLDPPRDLRQRKGFPSFCLLQFIVRQSPCGKRLDCIAYFRKQEMRQWWLVNFAEIVRLRNDVLNSIRSAESDMKTGSVTTIAGRAKTSSSFPQVSVPAIDRHAAEDGGRARIADMVFALVSSDPVKKERGFSALRGYLDDVRPPEIFDDDGVPVALPGLRILSKMLEQLTDRGRPWVLLQEAVMDLANGNEQFIEACSTQGDGAGRLFQPWQNDTLRRIAKIEDMLGELF